MAGVSAEVLLEEEVDGALEHKGVVDGNVGDALDAVAAGLAAGGDGLVHHGVRDEEECLELRARVNGRGRSGWGADQPPGEEEYILFKI